MKRQRTASPLLKFPVSSLLIAAEKAERQWVGIDEEATRAHGFPERSVTLDRQTAAFSEAWLQVSLGDDRPPLPPRVQWFYNCAGPGPGAEEKTGL